MNRASSRPGRASKVLRIFLDTEFEEDGTTIMPISLGLVTEDDRELYLEFVHDEDRARANDFVRVNVLPHLRGQEQCTREQAAKQIQCFLGLEPKHPAEPRPPIEIWAYYADYDWVVFCQIFGTMMDLPEGCPMFCMDLQQWWVQLGAPEDIKPPKSVKAHNALADADWNKTFHARMERYSRWYHGGVGRDPTDEWEAADGRDRIETKVRP